MSYQANYTRGLWKCVCEACGRVYKNTQLRQRWDGFLVCEDDWEPRQPQDFVRGVADYQAPPYTRPEQADQFVPVCTPNSISAYAGWGQAGCAIAGFISPAFDPTANANDYN